MSDKKEETKTSIFDKFSFFKKLKTVKHIEIIIFVIFILIALLIAFSGSSPFSFLFNSNSKTQAVSTNDYSYFSTLDYVSAQEEKLTNLIQGIEGAGNVQVMLSVKSVGEIIYAKNIEEKIIQSSTTKTESIVFVTKDGQQEPLVLYEKLPVFNGVVVISQGAKDVKVKLNIISAVQTATGLSVENINVLV